MLRKNIVNIGGTTVDATSVMVKDPNAYRPTDELACDVIKAYWEQCDRYFPGSLKTGAGIERMFNPVDGDFWQEKGWLIRLLEKMPGYNGRLQVVVPNNKVVYGMNYSMAKQAVRAIRGYIIDKIDEISDSDDSNDTLYFCRSVLRYVYYHISNEENELIDGAEQGGCRFVTKELADSINGVKPASLKFDIPVGTKVTKLVSRIGKISGADKWVDIRDVSFHDDHDNYHERHKDMGWNYWRAAFGDAMTILENSYTFIISAHPIDYLRMSFGKNWTSCQTIDKFGIDRANDGHDHGGMCAGGTESYMLDNSTILGYCIEDLPEDGRPEYVDKIRRCNFHLGEDKIVQGRVYPDGRDTDGDYLSPAYHMRSILQLYVAGALDVPNFWQLKRGCYECGAVVSSYGPHYDDYNHYGDCNVSFLRRFDGYINDRAINVGNDIICPECGRNHLTSNNIFDDYCYERLVKCAHCGNIIPEREAIEKEHEWYSKYYCQDCAEYVE